jgi:hypothetical protein
MAKSVEGGGRLRRLSTAKGGCIEDDCEKEMQIGERFFRFGRVWVGRGTAFNVLAGPITHRIYI